MSPHDGGTQLEWGMEGRGMRALSQILSDESLSYSLNTFLRESTHFTFHGGALISYIYISCVHDDVIKWKHVPRHWLLCGEFTGDCGEFTGEFPSHRPVTRSFDVSFDLRLNKRMSKQSRRRLFETPSRSSWRHCNVVLNSDPVIRPAVGSFGVQRITLVQFWIGEKGQIGGSVHNGRNGLKFGKLFYPDYHSLKLTIFPLSGSLSLWCQIIYKLVLCWGGNKRIIRSL